jgi:hypothetical protein
MPKTPVRGRWVWVPRQLLLLRGIPEPPAQSSHDVVGARERESRWRILALASTLTVQHLVNVLLAQGQSPQVISYFLADSTNGGNTPPLLITQWL